MNETRYAKTLLLLLAGTFVLSSVIWYWWSDSLGKAYPSYLKSEKLDGIVVDVIKDTRSAARVTFVDGKKLSLPWASNFQYHEPNLPKWIMEGDRIVKKEDCDTIIVIRDMVEYLFVANTSIEIEENSAISAVRSFYKINHAIWSSPPPDTEYGARL